MQELPRFCKRRGYIRDVLLCLRDPQCIVTNGPQRDVWAMSLSHWAMAHAHSPHTGLAVRTHARSPDVARYPGLMGKMGGFWLTLGSRYVNSRSGFLKYSSSSSPSPLSTALSTALSAALDAGIEPHAARGARCSRVESPSDARGTRSPADQGPHPAPARSSTPEHGQSGGRRS